MLVKINVRRTTKLAKGNKNVRNRIVHKTYTVKQSFQDGGSENYEYIAYEYAFISKKDYVNSNDAGYEMVEDMFD